MTLKIRRVAYSMGAEVSGIDITRPLPDETFREIYQAMLDHCLLLFRGQPLTHPQYVAFSSRFGKLRKKQVGRLADYPEIKALISRPKTDGSPAAPNFNGSDWHADMTYLPTPIIITMLRAVELPEVGGDTQFANLYLAYETLSEKMRTMLEGLEGVHMEQESELDHSSPERLEASRRAKTAAHPLVRTHPETGRKALFIGDKVRLIAGMTPEESEPLLEFLRNHAQRPQFVYRHQWQKNDLVVWDQRSTNHNAIGDYDRKNELRHLEKTTLRGTAPTGYTYNDTTQTRNLTRTFAY
jgi:taurine dioxygenase